MIVPTTHPHEPAPDFVSCPSRLLLWGAYAPRSGAPDFAGLCIGLGGDEGCVMAAPSGADALAG